MTEYAWANGSPFKGDPNEVKAELDRIARSGPLTPEIVVSVAKSKRSVLHGLIYDGTTPEEALEKYRVARARGLLKAIVEVHEGEITTVRPYVRVTTDDGREWRSVSLPDVRAHEITRLKGVMRGVKRQLDDLNVYQGVSLAIEEALAA